ncbi:MAG TPA: TonB family protein [Terracidiphilus sp.]|nr:TonB family protein [Terracidiphilus sp.]
MFEDSTFETMGRIHTRSRGWMMATFAFNSSILLALVIIPILHPQMLPQITSSILMQAPRPVEEPKPLVRTEQMPSAPSATRDDAFRAPSTIPRQIYKPDKPEDVSRTTVEALGRPANGAGGPDSPFNGSGTQPVVRAAMPATQHVSSGVMQGMLIYKVVPTYPAVAQAIRASGTVVLQATISKTGAIENLRVVDGPPMLRQAALDAVRQWRYRPYMLNGQPVEVETTVNVEFKLN